MASAVETLIRSAVGKGVTVVADFNRKRLPKVDDHPFLTGIHQPMQDEKTLTELPVTGTIPAALDGRYLRIGPNPIAPDPASYHWFTGDGMVHALRIKDGRALWYRNRWIRSRQVAALLGVEPAPGPRHGSFETVNTNVVGIGGRTWALVEAGSYPVELSDELDEQTYNPFDDTLMGSFSAHPHFDPATGENHAICYEATEPDRVRHLVVSAEGKVVREEPISVRHGPSIHDCAITARYVLVFDLPVTFSMKKLIAGHSFPYAWNPDHQARVGLLPREGHEGDIIWCEVDPCYVFHPANAYELPDGCVIVDVVAHETMFAHSTQGPDSAASAFERWTIDPARRRVERRVVDRAQQEFPRYDERLTTKPYRYAYTMALPEGRVDKFLGATRLYKHDLEAGTRQVHDFGEGRYPGEFVFVPAHADAEEDEGWLVGLVVDLPGDTTELVILNARDFAGAPQASIHLPHRVPPGFHGNWIAA